VTSVRGARGGYQLSREPQAITVREVLVGAGGIAGACRLRRAERCGLRRDGLHRARGVGGLHETVLTYLGSYTLADLALRAPAEAPLEAKPEEAEDALQPAGARG
jgi:DNA-binding IscR family transcriptional regulator